MSKKPYSGLSRAGKYVYLQDLEKKRKIIEDESKAGPSQIETDKVPRLFEASNVRDDAVLPMDDPLATSAVVNLEGIGAISSDFESEDGISEETLPQDDHVPRASSSSQIRVNEMPVQESACSHDIVADKMMDQVAGSIVDAQQNLANERNEQSKQKKVSDEKNDSDDEDRDDEIEEISDERSNENNDSDVMEPEDEMESIGEDSDEQDNESSDPDDGEQGDEIRDEPDEEEVDGEDAREHPRPPPRNENDRPLYAGARITVAESMLLILSLLLKHNITGTCLSDIITVINLHCLVQGLKSNSLYKFRKYFSASQKQFNKHFYCSICLSSLESENTMCVTCNAKKGISYFIEMPFLEQLKEMFNREGFYELLQHRFHRQGVTPGTICDIYDGSLYSRYEETGFLSNANNISLTWYTDDVPVFKSSKLSMWPVYLTINELPYKYRMKRENTMLAALWCGNKKPAANSFIYTLRSEFQKLLRGTPCTLSDGRVVDIRGILLAGTCDLPAKAQFLNMTAYNGQFGCPNCTNPGESFTHPTGGTSHVHRYETEPKMRTTAETSQNAEQALLTGRAVSGVKGPCSFSKVMPDFIEGMAIDFMHGIFCGVSKRLLSQWFDPSFSSRPFSLVAVIAIINKKLLQLKPPKFVHRMPRSVEDLCHWKASELKMWFFLLFIASTRRNYEA